MNALKVILVIVAGSMLTGCTVTTRPSIDTMAALNSRLSNIEKAVKSRPNVTAKNGKEEKLTQSQKDLVKHLLDYFGGKL